MAIQPVPAAPAALPFPGLNEKAAGTYNASAFAWGNQMPAYADGIKALGDNVLNNANEAKGSADLAATKADDSVAARDIAVAAAQAAVNSPGAIATSTTSLVLGSGDKVFVLVESGKDFAVGQYIVASSLANPMVNYLKGRVKAYDKPSKTLTMGDVTASGAGTYADWSIAVGVGPNIVPRVAYDDRATLRAMTPVLSASIIVSNLGLFSFVLGSTEIDDDETCFATATGRWLLEAAALDVVDGWFKPVLDLLQFEGTRALHGSIINTVVSLSTNPILIGVAYVSGATPGDRVVVAPPYVIQGAGQPILSGVVAASGLVNIYAVALAGIAIPIGLYKFTVLKEF